MTKHNKKAPYDYMGSKQFKLFDFMSEFSEFHQFDDLSHFGCQNIEDNLIWLEKNGKIYFKNKIAFCPVVILEILLKMVLMKENLFF